MRHVFGPERMLATNLQLARFEPNAWKQYHPDTFADAVSMQCLHGTQIEAIR